jgi:O-antigen/teichoic acid export membrane protein
VSLRKNILANYVGTGFTVLAPVLALPWYLSALGSKQWGLVGFVSTMQAVLSLMDAGMSQALVREFAVRIGRKEEGRAQAATLLFGFERIYWGFALSAASVTALASELIATRWLNLGDIPVEQGRYAVYGAAAIFAAQFPGSVYRSLLVGAQAQVALNSVMLGGALLRHIGGVMVVLHSRTLVSYLAWHAMAALTETFVRSVMSWRTLRVKRRNLGWNSLEVRQTLSLVASMSGAVLLGALNVQMDKIILSRIVTVEEFGYYTIASTVAIGSLQLIYPIVQAALPRAVQMRNEPKPLRKFYMKLYAIVGSLVAVAAILYFFLGRVLLEFWLRDIRIVAEVYPLLSVLLIGTGMNALYNIGYVNWIARKQTDRILQVNGVSLLLSILLIPPLVLRIGAVGAAFGWLIINFTGAIISLEWLKNK